MSRLQATTRQGRTCAMTRSISIDLTNVSLTVRRTPSFVLGMRSFGADLRLPQATRADAAHRGDDGNNK